MHFLIDGNVYFENFRMQKTLCERIKLGEIFRTVAARLFNFTLIRKQWYFRQSQIQLSIKTSER